MHLPNVKNRTIKTMPPIACVPPKLVMVMTKIVEGFSETSKYHINPAVINKGEIFGVISILKKVG